ncbi:MAG: type II secretion system F family protein [Pseudomonadota bacterium]
MKRWRYTAETADKEIKHGVLTAEDSAEAVQSLLQRGLNPISAKPASENGLQMFVRRRSSLSISDLALFTETLADLLKAGLPVAAALGLLAKQAPRPVLRKLAAELNEHIRQGASLSEGLAALSTTIPAMMTALVSTGEALGDLGAQFQRLAEHYKNAAALRREMVSQLVYPAALFVLIGVTLVFLSFFVLPQFESIFANNGAPPPETEFVLAAGAFIRNWWLAMLVLPLLSVASLRILKARRRESVDAFVLRLPFSQTLVRARETGLYCRSLGALLVGGAPLADAMPIAASAVDNTALAAKLSEMEEDVRAGTALAIAAQKFGALPDEAIAFIEIGETTGALGPMTEKAAALMEARVSALLKRLAAIAGPVMTALMGLITAAVIAAVMSGVMSLNDAVYQ